VAKPITPQEMTAYVEATWNKCKKEAWQEAESYKREWVGLSDDEREHFRKLGFVGVLAVENKLKEKNS
jgi:hypothetical protein